VSWFRRWLARFRPQRDPLIERADKVIKNVDRLRITVVPKNARALDELRRLNARR
jgi:hypothetical protein